MFFVTSVFLACCILSEACEVLTFWAGVSSFFLIGEAATGDYILGLISLNDCLKPYPDRYGVGGYSRPYKDGPLVLGAEEAPPAISYTISSANSTNCCASCSRSLTIRTLLPHSCETRRLEQKAHPFCVRSNNRAVNSCLLNFDDGASNAIKTRSSNRPGTFCCAVGIKNSFSVPLNLPTFYVWPNKLFTRCSIREAVTDGWSTTSFFMLWTLGT